MIRPLRAATALATAATLLSCGDIGAPLRTEFYEWRLMDAGSTASFHWNREQLPVRFWAQDIYDLGSHTQAAIDTWKAAFLYREFDGVMVADSADADVIVRAGFPDGGGILQTRITECEALTELDLDIEAHTLTLPIHVSRKPLNSSSQSSASRRTGSSRASRSAVVSRSRYCWLNQSSFSGLNTALPPLMPSSENRSASSSRENIS